ncbi:AEC family transporter [Cognatishimia sp. WU-CL00825]|uniref:AEC family transporter n=1 Tax=Cognatishimia sp. WU-CL00825 TaxID=3127658 RepID=UPI003103ECD4
MQEIISIVLPVFIIVGLGYVANWRSWLVDTHFDALMKFATNFAVPCLLFVAISDLDLSSSFNPDLFISFYSGAFACFLIGVLGARYLFNRDWEDCISIGFSCFFSNTVMLGLPIAERAFGAHSLAPNFAIVSMHSLFCYSIGITAMETVKARGRSVLGAVRTVVKGLLRNILVLSILAAFFVNLSGLTLPGPIVDSFSLIAKSALPVALFAIGGILFRYKPEGDTKTVLFICFVSLIIHPAIALLIGTSLQLSQENLRAVVIMAAVAPGINSYLFASLYGRAMRVAASSVLFATGFTIISASLWLVILG